MRRSFQWHHSNCKILALCSVVWNLSILLDVDWINHEHINSLDYFASDKLNYSYLPIVCMFHFTFNTKIHKSSIPSLYQNDECFWSAWRWHSYSVETLGQDFSNNIKVALCFSRIATKNILQYNWTYPTFLSRHGCYWSLINPSISGERHKILVQWIC